MENQVDIAAFVSFDSRKAGMKSFLTAFQNLLHFFPSILDNDGLKVSNIKRIGNNGNFIDVRIAFESIYCMLDYHFARYFKELLGSGQT